MSRFFRKTISILIVLTIIVACIGGAGFSAFANELDSAETSAIENMVLFTYDSDIFTGCTMTVDVEAMGISEGSRFLWYKNKELFADAKSITFTQEDVGSKFYVDIHTDGDRYKSYSFVVLNTPSYYCYSQLNARLQNLYDVMLNAVKNYETRVDIDTSYKYESEELFTVNDMLCADHPELFYFTGSVAYYANPYVYQLRLNYKINGEIATTEQIKAAQKQVKNKLFYTISQMYSELAVTTEYTEALWVHDKVSQIITYTHSNNDQTIYGALIEGASVCTGYARLNQVMLQYIGIDAVTVIGSSIEPTTNEMVGHAWNLMWIDHHCLYTDVTWDDQEHHVFHLYFARTVENMAIDHIMKEDFENIKPTGDEHCCEYNYFAYYHSDHALVADYNGEYNAQQIADLKEEKIKGYAWGIVVYDPTGEDFTYWLTKDNYANLYDVFYAMDLEPASYKIYNLSMGNHKLGTETHIYFEKDGDPPSTTFTLSGNIISYLDEDSAVTISLYESGETQPLNEFQLSGNYVDYAINNLVQGSYQIEVRKDGHLTFTKLLDISENTTLDIELSQYGDVDLDGKITVIDATYIQKYLVSSIDLSESQKARADSNADGKLDIIDAAQIQLYLAALRGNLGK